MKPMRVADYIIERLFDSGINHIFMVTGRGALFLTDAVARFGRIKAICMHHEQSAAYASVAYAQYKLGLGACLVSTGCAATNTLSGVLSAWQDGIPCIFISGQHVLSETSRYTGLPIRTYGQQETDIVKIVSPITKYSVMLDDPLQLRFELEKALYLSQEGRKGPVWIDIPLDIQSMRINPVELQGFSPGLALEKPSNFEESLLLIKDLIDSSARPVVLLGSGVQSSGAVNDFEEFILKNQIPVVFSNSATDTYGSENELSIGSVGSMGCSRSGNFALQNADLVLVFGSRLSSMTTGNDVCKFARSAKIVVIDIDPIEHSKKGIRIDHLIVIDIKILLGELNTIELKLTNSDWVHKCIHWKKLFARTESKYRGKNLVDLYYLADCLSNTLPSNSVFVSDSGLVELILPTNIRFGNQKRCIHPSSQGAMGYALPAAIGAYFASEQLVVTVIGDGSIMMNLQELQTISSGTTPIKIFVINNNAYSIIRKRQVDLFRKRTIGTDVSNGVSCPDYEKVAKAFDLPFKRIDSDINLEDDLKEIFAMDGPVLCEIMGLQDQGYIEISQARTLSGALVRRPLEDQAPYLSREVFLSEMIVDPIDQ